MELEEEKSAVNEIEEEVNDIQGKQVRRYILTINNPEQTDEEFGEYVKNLEHFKYCIYQREKGEKTGTPHFQVFVVFTVGKRFNTMKTYFPTAHFEPVKGSNTQCRDYCSKADTRISGPYEIGEFAEQRQRTDIKDFYEMLVLGANNQMLAKLFTDIYMRLGPDKIEAMRQDINFSEFKTKLRTVKVTYIWGDPRTGKTSYVVKKYGLENIYRVTNYDYTAFDDYGGQKVLVLDEFDDSFKVTYMNNLLDVYPIHLRSRYKNKYACFNEVYIISNKSLEMQFIDDQNFKPAIYKAFIERIHNVIKFTGLGVLKYEKSTSTGEQLKIDTDGDLPF